MHLDNLFASLRDLGHFPARSDKLRNGIYDFFVATKRNSLSRRIRSKHGPELRIADLTTGNTTNVGTLAINQMGSMAVATTNPPSWAVLPTKTGFIAAGGVSTFDVIFDSNIVSNKGV